MATSKKPEPKKTETKKPEPKGGKKEKMSEKFVYTDKDKLVITDKNGKVMDFSKKDQKAKK